MRYLLLQVIDQQWKDHLLNIDHLKEGIGLRGYGQRDPLIEYKVEAATMFDELQASVRADVVNAIYHLQMRQQAPPPPTAAAFQSSGGGEEPPANGSNGATRRARRPTAAGSATVGAAGRVAAPSKVGRNDPCPCGSGKKFKRCHGA